MEGLLVVVDVDGDGSEEAAERVLTEVVCLDSREKETCGSNRVKACHCGRERSRDTPREVTSERLNDLIMLGKT